MLPRTPMLPETAPTTSAKVAAAWRMASRARTVSESISTHQLAGPAPDGLVLGGPLAGVGVQQPDVPARSAQCS